MKLRTPWTLASELVWQKTHRAGAYAFVTAGVLITASIAFNGYTGFVITIGAAIGVTLFSFIYSYIQYRRQMH